MINLKIRWQKLITELNVNPTQSEKMYAFLEKKYTEKHRRYHNLQHLRELFAYVDKYADLLPEKCLVELAIWYHDSIYSVWRPAKNELKSAELAERECEHLKLSRPEKKRLKAWIIGTKAHCLPPSHDTASGRLFMDFDTAILGAEPKIYEQYRKNIRAEYGIYPDLLYNAGRKKALQAFLEKPIFLTNLFKEKYEKQARANITQELKML